jgi:16S rRNA (uracil1498-N3)-methyltransferase
MSRPLRVHHPGLAVGELVLSEPSSRYVCRVHRLGLGSRIVLFDPVAGTEAEAELTLAGARARCRVEQVTTGKRGGLRGVSVFLGRPKASALERIVRDCVALSAGRLVVVSAQHCVPAGPDLDERRLREIAVDEARQCERSDLPAIEGPLPFSVAVDSALVEESRLSRHLVLDARARGIPLLDAVLPLSGDLHSPLALSLWIGPEGGFTEDELERLRRGGAQAVRLGELVLRVHSAVSAALATVSAASQSAVSSKWAVGRAAR